MNKKVLLSFVVAALMLIAATSVYLGTSSLKNGSKSDSDSSTWGQPESNVSIETTDSHQANTLLNSFGVIGQPYTLHSRSYQQGEEKVESAPELGWNGDMILQVNSATVLEYDPDDFDSDLRELWNNQMDGDIISDPCVLRLDMTLKNEDAEKSSGVRYQFAADMFHLGAYEDLIPENWQNPEVYVSVAQQYSIYNASFDKHAEGDDYYSFILQPGEEMDFTMQYLIDREYLNQRSPFLAISIGREIKCGVLFNDLKQGV